MIAHPRSTTAAALALAGLVFGSARLQGYDEGARSYFPSLTPPSSLLVAKTWNGGTQAAVALPSRPEQVRAEMILLQSLAGILLKQGSAEGIYIESNADGRFILQDLVKRRSLQVEYWSSPRTAWGLAERFAPRFGGRYVLCDIARNPDSLNVARMAAYRFEAVIVDALLVAHAESRQWTRVFDATDKDDRWFKTNWWPTWPIKSIALEQNNDPAISADYAFLNDYAPATGIPAFFEGTNSPLRLAFLSELASDAILVGWPHSDELEFTEAHSRKDASVVAANWCQNLALLSSFRDRGRLPLVPPLRSGPAVPETNVHYATFIFTDGDNVQWMHNNFLLNPNWWGNTNRGRVPVGWGISPCLRDLSPTLAEHLAENAHASTPAGDALLAMSPMGYCYPSLFSPTTRAKNAVRLGAYMKDLGLRHLIVLDKYGFETPEVYRPYLDQADIDAIFYWDAFGNYARYAGAIKWQSGKPIISAYTNLWGKSGPGEVAAALNQRPRNPRSPEGYSVVDVHAWSHGLDSVLACMRLLDRRVKVVTPDVLARLVQRALGPRALEHEAKER